MKKIFSLFAAILFAGSMMAVDFQLVNSTDDLVANANYVIGNAASGSGRFMATTNYSDNRRATDAITITDGTITATENVLILKLEGSTGAWKLKTTNYEGTDGYLANADTGTGNKCFVGTTEREFTIVFSGDAVVITATGGNARNILRYNTSGLFACYGSGQSAIYLFKEVGCESEVAITKGAETNGTYTLSAESVCADGDGGMVEISAITPADGYLFDKITTSASGVVDNANKKVTGIKAATTITVLFKEMEKYTVSFNVGASSDTQDDIAELAAGEGITLPAGPTPDCSSNGWSFAGWAEAAVATQTTTAPTLFAAGDTYHPTDDCTLYAVYKKTEEGTTAWSLCATSESVVAGTYVITWNNTYYLPSETLADKSPAVGSGITQADNKLTNTVSSAMKWTLTGNNSDGFVISHKNGDDTYYLAEKDDSQGVSIVNEEPSSTWKATVDASAGMILSGSTGNGRSLAVYNNATWRYYKASSTSYSGTLRLYKESAASTINYHSAPTCGGGTPTAVDNTEATVKAVKFIENGQLFIEKNGHVYNVQGQIVK